MAKSLLIFLVSMSCTAQSKSDIRGYYLDLVKTELEKKWPKNRTIQLVFHGHSVPSGYFKTPKVNTLAAYPHSILKTVTKKYPTAVINSIVTAIGGEESEQGAARFKEKVLVYKPDVLFIDYALNDRRIGLERAKIAWEQMITEALTEKVKVVLLTPTPDLTEDILDDNAPLEQHRQQIRELATTYNVGLVDSYAIFKEIAKKDDLTPFMAQSNHINEKGHQLVAKAIMDYF